MTKNSQQKYRHELKYIISHGDYILLAKRLACTLWRDSNARETGDYHIRSLYFDDIHDTAMHQKLDGLELRRKTRIRIYNLSDALIRLESKEKKGSFISKQSLTISREVSELLIAGDPRCLLRAPAPLGPQVYALMRTQRLAPVVIVDYVREAYVHPLEDVRITFDKDLRTGLMERSLFDEHMRTIPAFSKGETIMEVKFNRYLPDYIASLLQVEHFTRSALSKYVICRQFEA